MEKEIITTETIYADTDSIKEAESNVSVEELAKEKLKEAEVIELK